eukprot:6183160-Pleurochrysis_carterae.AAC.2
MMHARTHWAQTPEEMAVRESCSQTKIVGFSTTVIEKRQACVHLGVEGDLDVGEVVEVEVDVLVLLLAQGLESLAAPAIERETQTALVRPLSQAWAWVHTHAARQGERQGARPLFRRACVCSSLFVGASSEKTNVGQGKAREKRGKGEERARKRRGKGEERAKKRRGRGRGKAREKGKGGRQGGGQGKACLKAGCSSPAFPLFYAFTSLTFRGRAP